MLMAKNRPKPDIYSTRSWVPFTGGLEANCAWMRESMVMLSCGLTIPVNLIPESLVKEHPMAGLLYPAYQKYYSALRSLQAFNLESSFFDNIASLDGFFSEYRSVTLVLQTSLAHTQYEEIYERFPKESWDPFFNQQRVKVVHKHPIEFTKTIKIDLYYPDGSTGLLEKAFSVDDDRPLSELMHEMRQTLEQFGSTEVFFSARFSFTEKSGGQDIWGKLIGGLFTMKRFMDYMYSEIGEKCPICEELRKRIDLIDPMHLPEDFVSVIDYAYYPKTGEFERANRIAALPGFENGGSARMPIERFGSMLQFGAQLSLFEKFVMVHLPIASGELMPVIMTVYDDGTFTLDVFSSSIKTTIYRKIGEKAREISGGGIREVFLMIVYVFIDADADGFSELTAPERARMASGECLSFFRLGADLQNIELDFDLQHIHKPDYISSKLNASIENEMSIGNRNMTPIINAFKDACLEG